MNIPFISNEQILKSITMDDAISAMEIAFKLISEKKAKIPLRINMSMPEFSADSLIMPVYSADLKRYSVKTVSLNYKNKVQNLPLIHSTLTLFDASNGIPLAFMDAEMITALRTGGASGLATRRLSYPQAKELVAFGAGIQSEYQIRAVLAVRDIKKVTLISRTREKALNLIDRLKCDYRIEFKYSNNVERLQEADIITTATTSTAPLFENIKLKEQAHINAVGSYKATLIEIDPALIASSALIFDQKSSAMLEAGDIQNAINKNFKIDEKNCFELGEIPEDEIKLKSKRTIFKSVGNAMQDLVLASEIYDKLYSGSVK